jgi:hypothetical protein
MMSMRPGPSTLPEEEKTDNSPQLAKNLRRKFFSPGSFSQKTSRENFASFDLCSHRPYVEPYP